MNIEPMPSETPRPRGLFRRWRWLLIIASLLVLFVALIPPALGAYTKSWLAAEWSARYQGECRIAALSLGLSGFDIRGVEIDNASGFDRTHPLLRLDHASGSFSWTQLLSGRLDLAAQIRGLEVYVDEDATGRTNFAALFGDAGGVILGTGDRREGDAPLRPLRGDPSDRDGDDPLPPAEQALQREDLDGLRIDLAFTDGRLEVRRAGELVEALQDLTCTVAKDFGDPVIAIAMSTKLHQLRDEDAPGAITASARLDAATETMEASFSTQGIDLERYGPLLFAETDGLTQLAGVLGGELQLRPHASIPGAQQLSGELAIAGPRLAGPALAGMDVHADRWTLRPELVLGGGRPPAGAVTVDLGFLQARVEPVSTAAPAAGERDALRVSYTADLARLVALGGPLRDTLEPAGTLRGEVTLPRDPDAHGAEQLLRQLVAAATIEGAAYRRSGFAALGIDATVSLEDGVLSVATGPAATLNSGALQVSLQTDLADPERRATLALDWQGGRIDPAAASTIRYLVPLFAGVGEGAGQLVAAMDLHLELTGTRGPAEGQTVLDWLDGVAGDGHVALRDGAFAPAPALAGLLQLLQQDGRLAIDDLTSTFRIEQGAVRTKTMEWLSKGRRYGLSGTVGFDGALDFGIDVAALLDQHKDGKIIASYLQKHPLRAGLTGTIDSPSLGVPDVAAFLQQALLEAPQQLLQEQAAERLQREIQRSLEKLFGGRKE